MIIPCRICQIGGDTRRRAIKLAPQTEKVHDHNGAAHYVWHWLPVCAEHAARWYGDGQNEGNPPMYALGEGTRALEAT